MNKKIFLINSLGKGGAERQASLIINRIKELIPILLEPEIAYPISRKWRIVSLLKIKRFKIIQFFECFICINKKKPVTIVSFLEFSNYINIFSKYFFNKHFCIISMRNSISYHKGAKGFVNKFLIKLLYPFADVIVSNSHDNAENLKSIIPSASNKIIHIPNALNDFIYSTEKYSPPKDKLKLIMLGRLIGVKNIAISLKIIKKLKNKIDVNITYIGDGPELENLIKYAHEIGLTVAYDLSIEADCYFLGRKDNPEKYLKTANLYLLTSKSEGLPNTLLEAMANKIPCISSDCPTGPSEILNQINKHFNILLPVPTNLNYEIWVDAILRIHEQNLYTNLSELCFNEALKYHESRILKKWEKIISNS